MEVLRSILSCFSSRSRTRARPGAQSHHGLWSSGASDKNKSMVEQLQRYGVIRSTKVAEVMEAIDRGLFVPLGGTPYHDSPMPIGYNATISAPHMHAACLELLEKNLQPGMRALDVGSGTGYLTACFALMVGPEGRAVGVEHIPELVATSIENIKKSAAAPQLNDGSLSIHVAESFSSVRGLGKGVSGKPYPGLCNARRPRLEPGTFRSQTMAGKVGQNWHPMTPSMLELQHRRSQRR
ncbi:protein-L-isoaspartate O-methyltransferase-like isoform X2 [Miscanthus floridulus]|uniref:protein-L-isoaspartate O-methyltransferase-like isoform X2 n=1 Tax=Miscanthus floridulus TaxID=154761 RepID=UPI003457F8F0